MKLSKRLETVVSFAQKPREWRGCVYRIADVGTDHGYVPIAMAQRDPSVRAIAMDVGQGPLKRAKEHIARYGLEQQICTRLGDGAEKLEAGEADTVIVAGMGGELVIHILEGGRHLWDSVKRWVLSPQSEPDKVRRYLEDQGFVIADEEMVEEDGKYYTILAAERGEKRKESGEVRDQELSEARYLYGPRLIEKKHPVLMEFLKKEESQLTKILESLEKQEGEKAALRSRELRQKLLWIRKAVEEMG